GALYLTFGILIFFIGCEILLDLPTSSLEVQVPALIVNASLIIAYFRKINIKLQQILFITYIFALLESHIWANPYSFHTLIYWFPFVPIAAIIISGLKQAIIWLLVIVLANTLNLFYVESVLGDSYEVTMPLMPIFTIGLVFTFAMFTYTFFLYRLLGDAYFKMKIKSDDLETVSRRVESTKKRLVDYQKTLFDLSKDPTLTSGNFQNIFKKICKTA